MNTEFNKQSIKHIAEWNIVGEINSNEGGVAIGYSSDSPTPYATWIHMGNYDYIQGRYFVDKDRALLDFYDRAKVWGI